LAEIVCSGPKAQVETFRCRAHPLGNHEVDGADLAYSVYVIKAVKWLVDTDRLLLSPDPHVLVMWVNEIYRLRIGHRFPVPQFPIPPLEAAETGTGVGGQRISAAFGHMVGQARCARRLQGGVKYLIQFAGSEETRVSHGAPVRPCRFAVADCLRAAQSGALCAAVPVRQSGGASLVANVARFPVATDKLGDGKVVALPGWY
jgi:hypothetical protein